MAFIGTSVNTASCHIHLQFVFPNTKHLGLHFYEDVWEGAGLAGGSDGADVCTVSVTVGCGGPRDRPSGHHVRGFHLHLCSRGTVLSQSIDVPFDGT